MNRSKTVNMVYKINDYSGGSSANTNYLYATIVVVIVSFLYIYARKQNSTVVLDNKFILTTHDDCKSTGHVSTITSGKFIKIPNGVFVINLLNLRERLKKLNVNPSICKVIRTNIEDAKKNIIKFIEDNGYDISDLEEKMGKKETAETPMSYGRARYSNDLNDDDSLNLWEIMEYITYITNMKVKYKGNINLDLIEGIIVSATNNICPDVNVVEGFSYNVPGVKKTFPQISPYETRIYKAIPEWGQYETDVKDPNSRKFLSQLDHLSVAGDGNNLGAGDSYINNIRNATKQGQKLLSG